MIYVRVQDGVVMETFTPPADVAIEDCFHPDLVAQFRAIPEGVEGAVAGWLWTGDTPEPPPPPPPTASDPDV